MAAQFGEVPETAAQFAALLPAPDGVPPQVSLQETHISRVFLTGDTVYKLKKPVRYSFLDYSTLELRREACLSELELNRRLAPDVYLGIVAITRTRDGIRLGGTGPVLDYCVHMKRLPRERMLDHLIRTGAATPRDISRLLDVLVPFYARARRGPEMDQYATAEHVTSIVRDNLAVIQPDPTLPLSLFQRVRASQLQFIQLHQPLFRRRIREGHVCEGHGDLRPEHVCMLHPPVVFDCVEFSLPFRSCDIIAELAFLAMECELLEAPELAEALLAGYHARAHVPAPEDLANFYKSHRACVRAKVDLLRGAQQAALEQARLRRHARRYLQLASFYATSFYRPKLIVMLGAAGTGKSTVAAGLSAKLGSERLQSDVIRHELCGAREPQAGLREGIYTPEMSQRVYGEMFRRAAILLREAVSVVLDATFSDPHMRHAAIALGREYGADVHFVLCQCPSRVAKTRIDERVIRGGSISDARGEVHDAQIVAFRSLEDIADQDLFELDTSGPESTLLRPVIAHLSGCSRE